MFKDDEGRTEKATPGRKSEARGKGQVALSREMTMAGVLIVAVFALENLGGWLIASFKAILTQGMSVNLDNQFMKADGGRAEAVAQVMWIAQTILPPVATLMAIFLLAALLFGYGQIGIKFSTKALALKPERLNPVKGVSKLFNFAQVFKTLVSAAKIAVLIGVLFYVLSDAKDQLATLNRHTTLMSAAKVVVDLALDIFFWVSLIVLLLGVADFAYQRYNHEKQLRMTKQEVEDERKRNDGDPFIKGRMRSARMEMFKQRIAQVVPKADVVITNPTHFAVALAYDKSSNTAPEVVAKGLDDMALKIREIAAENDIPVMEDPPLARALYRAVKIGQEVPERFYKAVATVLGHVYRVKGEVA